MHAAQNIFTAVTYLGDCDCLVKYGQKAWDHCVQLCSADNLVAFCRKLNSNERRLLICRRVCCISDLDLAGTNNGNLQEKRASFEASGHFPFSLLKEHERVDCM